MGYIETYAVIKNINHDLERMEKSQSNMQQDMIDIKKFMVTFESKLSSNLKWTIGLMVTIISIIGTGVIFIVDKILK